jgi:NAD dependent epimerase/dehydratase family enzyme
MTLPAAALRLMFGEVADAAMLASARVRPRRLLDSGFAFDHPHLEEGLRFVLRS